MTKHLSTCPVAADNFVCHYSYHDFDACNCGRFAEHPVLNVTQYNGEWHLYLIRGRLAYSVYSAKSLDDCREYCRCAGRNMLIGSPSFPWGNLV